VISGEQSARQILENPTLSAENRKQLLGKIGDALALDTPIRNFLGLLIDRNRLDLLEEIVSTYEALLDEKLGIVKARVTTALELDANQREQIAARLHTLTGKKVRMETVVDPSLIGGLVAQVGSTIYDGSIRQQLQTFKNGLTQD
jgi:F-type H+-transporting ATPase subunit delta